MAGHRIGLYQRVQVSYNSRLITALVVEEELHPHHPENNTVCINSAARQHHQYTCGIRR